MIAGVKIVAPDEMARGSEDAPGAGAGSALARGVRGRAVKR